MREIAGPDRGGAVTDAEFAGLCATYGRPELASDPRFVDTPSRMANANEMVVELAEAAEVPGGVE